MREILFRGKRVSDGEWVTGYYIRAEHHWHNHGIHKDWIACGASANGGWFALHNKYPVIAETIGQYTGMDDKYGKKIFGGDIIRAIASNPVGEDFEAIVIVNLDEYEMMWDIEHSHELEVIGNIHDNPELLEVKHEDKQR